MQVGHIPTLTSQLNPTELVWNESPLPTSPPTNIIPTERPVEAPTTSNTAIRVAPEEDLDSKMEEVSPDNYNYKMWFDPLGEDLDSKMEEVSLDKYIYKV